jgi:hypothetical protein
MNLAGLNDENVTRFRFELLTLHVVQTTSRLDELDLVVRVTVRARASAWLAVEEEHGDVHIAVALADEVMRAALEWQILLTNAEHD